MDENIFRIIREYDIGPRLISTLRDGLLLLVVACRVDFRR